MKRFKDRRYWLQVWLTLIPTLITGLVLYFAALAIGFSNDVAQGVAALPAAVIFLLVLSSLAVILDAEDAYEEQNLSWFWELLGSLAWPITTLLSIRKIFRPAQKQHWSPPQDIFFLPEFVVISLGIQKWSDNDREVWLPRINLVSLIGGVFWGIIWFPQLPVWFLAVLWCVGFLLHFRNAFAYIGLPKKVLRNRKDPVGFTNSILLVFAVASAVAYLPK